MRIEPRWHLSSSLTGLLALASAIAFLFTFLLLLAYYQPRLAEEARDELSAKSLDLAQRTEHALSLLEGQLELLASALSSSTSTFKNSQVLLDRLTHQNGYSAVYRIRPDGRVTQASIKDDNAQSRLNDLLNSDLSNNRLRNQVTQRLQTVWSDKYLSPVSQRLSVAIGVWTGNEVVIGEIPLELILKTVTETGNPKDLSIWVADAYGEILADTEDKRRVGVTNLSAQTFFNEIRNKDFVQSSLRFEATDYQMAAARSHVLGWSFIVKSPSGFKAPKLRTVIDLGGMTLLSLIVLSLVLAPLWTTRMARPIKAIADGARRVADGKAVSQWPRSSVIELNQLSYHLESMERSIRDREQELEAIFELSPAGMLVADIANNYAFIRVNDAIVDLLGYQRDELLGKNGQQLGLWKDKSLRDTLLHDIEEFGQAHLEAWLVRKDGSEFLAQINVRKAFLSGRWRIIWVAEDVTDIRELNAELEKRVQKRTEQLAQSNQELSEALERLQITQHELIQSEKLASLGSLVAGVAHELNTPIGNGVMAVTTLRKALKTFRDQSAEGLKRSMLDTLVQAVDTGSDIAQRNLQRAAELVSSFKQVAADQTSSQRRSFALDEMIHEVVLTLQPTLRHSAAKLQADVPQGIQMDSYPGPLGQVLTNLIGNATMHAFADKGEGTISVTAVLQEHGQLKLSVSDDGCGIPEEMLPKIFDPFVTSKMGRGGTGLGLHIAHNIVLNVLGGSIAAHSEKGMGSTFELVIPLVAPQSGNSRA
ncbi:sensor histidine kinase [Azonexus sp. IMCC34839]|uniref:sensor histidine kinase n=1 Tax=Azonexus sp. IMCC34839 TaxID=3133695 RepID=UPI00399B88C1